MRRIELYLTGQVSNVHADGEISAFIPMRSGIRQGPVKGPTLVLIFVNEFPNALEALKLLITDVVKIATCLAQQLGLQTYLIIAWDWAEKWDLPSKPAECSYLTNRREVPLRLSFVLDGPGIPHLCQRSRRPGRACILSSVQCSRAANKVRRLIFMIKRSFQDLSKLAFISLFVALKRPH